MNLAIRLVQLSLIAVACLSCALLAAASLAQEQEGAATKPAATQPVEHGKLKQWLPAELGGLKRTSENSQAMSMAGMNYAMADGNYGEGEKRIGLTVTDYAAHPEDVQRMGAFIGEEIDNQSDTSYMKTTKIEGFPALETFDLKNKMGNLTIYVGDRFFVSLGSNGLGKDVFVRLHSQLNLKELAELGGGPTTRPAEEKKPE